MSRQKIAIIGTGISGLACAHFLHGHHDITVFEKEDRIGGHSHTVVIPEGDRAVALDTGFMVYNEVTYPLLTRLFKQLEVVTKPTSMSFSVQHRDQGLEFNGGSLDLLFSQRRNLVSLRFWRMLLQIDRFNRETVDEVEQPKFPQMTLAEYVKARGYGSDFFRLYLAPMAAAVWSSPPERIGEFPAATLMRFWFNHGFLGLKTQHPWRTVDGGSRRYVEKMTVPFGNRIHRGAPVATVGPGGGIVLDDGSEHRFDRVIVAAHGDQALSMLAEPNDFEADFLSAFRYQKNQAVVHTDSKVMPVTRRCWASWNYRVEGGSHSTHYWMNNLQGVSESENYFVSINPSAVDPSKIIRRMDYEHPLFDLRAIAAQDKIDNLHEAGDASGRYFCGAWQRYGFHEDGIWSAAKLCAHILGRDPWS